MHRRAPCRHTHITQRRQRRHAAATPPAVASHAPRSTPLAIPRPNRSNVCAVAAFFFWLLTSPRFRVRPMQACSAGRGSAPPQVVRTKCRQTARGAIGHTPNGVPPTPSRSSVRGPCADFHRGRSGAIVAAASTLGVASAPLHVVRRCVLHARQVLFSATGSADCSRWKRVDGCSIDLAGLVCPGPTDGQRGQMDGLPPDHLVMNCGVPWVLLPTGGAKHSRNFY